MTLALEILGPGGRVVQSKATAIQAVDETGSFGLLPGHENFCAVLVPSILMYRDAGGGERYVAVDGGVLLLEDDRASVVTREAVPADSMDSVAETVATMLDARQQQEKEAGRVFSALVGELLQELSRLEVRQ